MPSFAEIMMQQAGESSQKVGQGLAQSFATGAQLAMEQERVQQGRLQIQQQKAQLEQAKLAKFAEAVEKGQQYAGKAQKNYYDKFLPAFRDSLGLTDKFNNETLQFMTASPENLGRVRTLIADVRSGRMTEQEAIGILSDPVTMADIPVTSDTYKTLGEAAKTAIENKQQITVQKNQLTATEQNAETARAATGQVKVDEQAAKNYDSWTLDGGRANVNKNIKNLNDALGKLQAAPKDSPSGGKSGAIGDKAMDYFNPEAASIRDQILESIQGTLKEIRGAQFAASEAEQVFKLAYNPRLSNAENARKVKSTLEGLRNQVRDKEAAMQYFEKNKTMRGYQAPAVGQKTFKIRGKDVSAGQLRLAPQPVLEAAAKEAGMTLEQFQKELGL